MTGAELLRWVGVAMEFTEALLAESVDSGSLTQNERGGDSRGESLE